MLFLYSEHADGSLTVANRLKLGTFALDLWLKHGKISDWTKKEHFFNRRSRSGCSQQLVRGLLHLAALALFVDMESRRTRRASKKATSSKKAKTGFVDDTLTVLNRKDLDPTIPAVFLLEVKSVIALKKS